jgi:hypothetical protein
VREEIGKANQVSPSSDRTKEKFHYNPINYRALVSTLSLIREDQGTLQKGIIYIGRG